MKLQQTPNYLMQNQQQKNSNPSFKGMEFVATGLNFLQTSPAVGATMIDVGCMCAPRTIIDFTRSPEAGVETARREFTSTINDAAIGVYGMGAAWLLANTINSVNKDYGIKSHTLLVDDDMIEVAANIWDKTKDKQAFLEEFVSRIEGFNPDGAGTIRKTLDKETQQKIVKRFMTDTEKHAKMDDLTKKYLKSVAMQSIGVEDEIRVTHGKLKATSTLDEMFEGLFKLTKTFTTEKVAESFKNGNVAENAFVKGMKSLNKNTAILGVGVSVIIGLCVQPFNNYLTKKKTGKSGFVGGGGENKTGEFLALKAGIAGVAGALGVWSIGDHKIKNLVKNIQFKSVIPTVSQFKMLYGATIISRILSARNGNELRETTLKDSLGFVNWLILGGFVSKFTAKAFEKYSKDGEKYLRASVDEIEKAKPNQTQGIFKKAMNVINSSVISRNEVLVDAFKKIELDFMKHDGVAKSMGEMLKDLKDYKIKHKNSQDAKIIKNVDSATKALSKMRKLAIIQVAGYVYSGVVLGYFIPKLNIAMTKAFSKNEQAEQAK